MTTRRKRIAKIYIYIYTNEASKRFSQVTLSIRPLLRRFIGRFESVQFSEEEKRSLRKKNPNRTSSYQMTFVCKCLYALSLRCRKFDEREMLDILNYFLKNWFSNDVSQFYKIDCDTFFKMINHIKL
jgi:hypothetical protein